MCPLPEGQCQCASDTPPSLVLVYDINPFTDLIYNLLHCGARATYNGYIIYVVRIICEPLEKCKAFLDPNHEKLWIYIQAYYYTSQAPVYGNEELEAGVSIFYLLVHKQVLDYSYAKI